MGNKRESNDLSSMSQSSNNATMEESAGIQTKKRASEEENVVLKNQISGYIFMCNGKTKADCYRYRVFGLPAARINDVDKIRPRMTLFLFDFDTKLLYGVYAATSNGGLGIEPTAFGGKFSAQVKFEISNDCLPLPECMFKHAIRDNYSGGYKFKQELNNEQVTNLTSLFHPITIPPILFAKTRPAAEISASYDQYLAELKVPHFGMPSSSSEVWLASHSHGAMSRSAAHWVAVASEDHEVIGPDHQRMPSTLYAPVSTESALVVPSIQEKSRRGTSHFRVAASNALHDSMPFHYRVPSYGGMHLPLLPAVKFSDDLKDMHFEPHQRLPPGSAGVETGPLPLPYLATTVSCMSVPGSSGNEVNTIATPIYASHYDAVVSAAEASSVGFVQVPQQPSVSSYGYAYSPLSPGTSAYWNGMGYGYNHSQGVSVTNEMSRAHSQAPPRVPEPSWTAVSSQGLSQVIACVPELSSENGTGSGYKHGQRASVTNKVSRQPRRWIQRHT